MMMEDQEEDQEKKEPLFLGHPLTENLDVMLHGEEDL